MQTFPFLALALLLSPPVVLAARMDQSQASASLANPIRKVVTMLQDMQAKVTEQGKKEEELFEKFMCYCKDNKGQLSAGMDESQAKIENLGSTITESTEKKAQTEQSLKDHQNSRSEAKDAMAKATAVREKEAAAFSEEDGELKANVAALGKAITAIEKGMTGSFLQTTAANGLRKFVIEKAVLSDDARQELLSFLSGSEGYVPRSGEIVGILKQLKDEMSKEHADAIAEEEDAIKSYDALMSAKAKEVSVLTEQIEAETKRAGELGVEIASMSNDLEDTKESLAEDGQFLAKLESDCGTKTQEWEEIKATRAEELVALAEVIKTLNDDDALELFKKTLPSASSSFVQLQAKAASVRSRALSVLRASLASHPGKKGALPAQPQMGLLELALGGKQIGFDKVIKMIDDMVLNLKTEQKDDDAKKEYCNVQLDSSEDKQKGLETSISNSEAAIEELTGSISTLKEEIEALKAGIKALDKSVAEATTQRKAENEDHKTLIADNSKAKEILLWAKNRLYKFYTPKMYKAPEKRPLSEDEALAQLSSSPALVQLQRRRKDAQPEAPEAPGPYKKKTQESEGVISMIDLLVKDLDKEMQESGVTEKDSQRDYEEAMSQAAKKRASDSKSLTDKEASVASEEEMLQAEKDGKASASKELMMTLKYIKSLHGECDWLVKYFDVRKEARASEIDALGKAKAVLSGADFSLMQMSDADKVTSFLLTRH